MWDRYRDGPTASDADDAEYVERVRRGIAQYDRWRGALVVFHASLAVVFVALLVAATEFVRQWVNNIPGLGPGFMVGLAMGAALGLLAVKIAHGLVGALSSAGRYDRLLVRYHDILQELRREPTMDAESGRTSRST
jgi:hypothetical protein